jgi:hypothetical protein
MLKCYFNNFVLLVILLIMILLYGQLASPIPPPSHRPCAPSPLDCVQSWYATLLGPTVAVPSTMGM